MEQAHTEPQTPKIALCIAPAWSLETPPLSLGLLAAVADNLGCEFKQFDINMLSAKLRWHESEDEYNKYWGSGSAIKWTNEEIFNQEVLPKFEKLWWIIAEEMAQFDIITFTLFYSNVLATDLIAKRVKELNPDIHIYYGGPYCWNDTKGGYKVNEELRHWVNLGCSIEGEGVFEDAIKAFLNNTPYSEIQGVWTLDDSLEARFSGPRPAIRDLNSIPPANWDGLNLESYAPFQHKGEVQLPIQGSRGCTFKCTFCSETRVYRF